MRQINMQFFGKLYELNAIALKSGINAPWLEEANAWAATQQLGVVTGNTGAGTASRGNGTMATNFDDAVLVAVKSSPRGTDIATLQPILASYGRPNNQIGAALARLTKQGKIVKGTDQLWHFGQARKTTTIGEVVSAGTTASRRQTRRIRAQTPPAAAADESRAATA